LNQPLPIFIKQTKVRSEKGVNQIKWTRRSVWSNP